MKKLTVMIGIIVASAVSYAANINWNTGVLKAPTSASDGTFSETTAKAGGYSVSVVMAFYLDNDGVKGDAISGVSNTSSTTYGATGAVSGITSGYDFVQGNKYWAAATVVLTKGSDSWTMEVDPFKFEQTKGTGNLTVNMSTLGYMPTSWTAAPEPTTAILLLLGFAGLGLKRKIA